VHIPKTTMLFLSKTRFHRSRRECQCL